jgi:Protein of unknown function (DUF2782)
MRRLLLLSLTAAFPFVAQQAPPPKLEPLPEPPPPIGIEGEPPAPGPTISPGAKITEYTSPDGKKYIHVVEPNGFEYYLIESLPGEPGGARTLPSDSGVRPPMWVILQW